MRIGFIGSDGHWSLALSCIEKDEVVGVAPGYPGEDISSVKNTIEADWVGGKAQEYKDYKDMLEDIEVAVVSSNCDMNAVITADCLKKDIYVYCEKPLATSLEQLDMLEEVAKTSKAFVSAMFNIRCESWYQTIKKSLPKIGKVRMVNAQKSYKFGVYNKKKDPRGGIIPWVAIHSIDWIQDMASARILSVNAIANSADNYDNDNYEVTALCQFEMENDIIASVNADFYRPEGADTHGDDRIRVVGTKGILEHIGGVVTLINENGKTELELEKAENSFGLFLRRVNGEDVGPSMEDSIYATRVALIARDNSNKGAFPINK